MAGDRKTAIRQRAVYSLAVGLPLKSKRDQHMGSFRTRIPAWTIAATFAVLTCPGIARAQIPTAASPSIRILGVSLPDKDPAAWWTADGKKLGADLLSDHTFSLSPYTPGKDEQIARIMIEIRGAADADDDCIKAVEASGYSSQTVVRADGTRVILLQMDFPAAARSAAIRCGIASDTWVDVAEATGSGTTSTNGTIVGADGSAPIDIVFSEPFPYEKGTGIVVSTTVTDRDTRIVGIDAHGNVATPQMRGDTSINALEQRMAVFTALAPGEIKSVKLQGRSYKWTDLKDIALQPAP